MTKHASHRWICLVGGLLAGLLSVGGAALATSSAGNPSAQRQVAGHMLTIAVLAERRGAQISDRSDVLPLTFDPNADVDEDSDGSEWLTATLMARSDWLPCAASIWAARAGSLLLGAIAPLAHVRLQI